MCLIKKSFPGGKLTSKPGFQPERELAFEPGLEPGLETGLRAGIRARSAMRTFLVFL